VRRFFCAFIWFALSAGCSAPPKQGERADLSQPVVVTTAAVLPSSMLTLHRGGALDPIGQDVSATIVGVDLRLLADAQGATLEMLRIPLGDVDIPPSATLPDGVHLRDLKLETAGPLKTEVVARTAQSLATTAVGALKLSMSLLLADGSRYRLGATSTADATFTLKIEEASRVRHATLDAALGDECWRVDGLYTFSHCALHLDAEADIASP
jgi:hypothetical protein